MGLEDDAVGEHEVAYFAYLAFQHAAGVVFVEEVVEGHGEHEQDFAGVGFVGVGDGKVETQAACNHVFVGGAENLRGAGAADGVVVEDTSLEGGALAANHKSGTGLEVVAAQVLVVGHEAYFLALVVGTGIETYNRGHPGGIETYAEVAEAFEGCSEGTVVGTIDVVRVSKSLFVHADGKARSALGIAASIAGLLSKTR